MRYSTHIRDAQRRDTRGRQELVSIRHRGNVASCRRVTFAAQNALYSQKLLCMRQRGGSPKPCIVWAEPGPAILYLRTGQSSAPGSEGD
jgi:hypothetical protein